MAQSPCLYCKSLDARCVVAGGGHFLTECKTCGRVVEERTNEVSELFIERAYDAPLCIVTPDFSVDEAFKAPAIEDDPFENISFITAFSTWSLERAPLFTELSTSYGGQLAELERILYDSPETSETSVANGSSVSASETLRAYFQIQEISSILSFERDTSDHAFQLFKECVAATSSLRNRNIEALATAAIVQASREGREPRTLQEISGAANVSQKDIAKHMKMLSDALNLSQPINSNSISAHMPRFCQLLGLSKSTQDLATHIGEVVINKNFCTRRNPVSISAAAIYLSCQVEDKRKTQTEICKATGLTEVTLRKVYKELVEHLSEILPPDYTPAISLEKIFPASNGTAGRNHSSRISPALPVPDSAMPRSSFTSRMSTSSGSMPDSKGWVGGGGSNSPLVQPKRSGLPASGAPAEDRTSGPPPPFSNGRLGGPSYAVPPTNLPLIPGNGTLEASLRDNGKDSEQNPREWQERALDKQVDYATPMNINIMPSPAGIPGFIQGNHGFWLPPHHFYSTAAPPALVRSENVAAATQSKDKEMEDTLAAVSLANSTSIHPQVMTANSSEQPQFFTVIRGMPDGRSPNMHANMIPTALSVPPGRPIEVFERPTTTFNGREPQHPDKKRDPEAVDASDKNHSTPTVLGPGVHSLGPNAAAAAIQTYSLDSTGRQGPQAFPPIPTPPFWPYIRTFAPGPYGVYPTHLPGGLPPAFFQVGAGAADDSAASEKNSEGLQHGILAPASAETIARMTGAGMAGQANPLAMQWAGPGGAAGSFPFLVAPPLNLATIPGAGFGPGSAGSVATAAAMNAVPNATHGGNGFIDRNTGLAQDGGGGVITSQRPTPGTTERLPILSMAIGNSQGQFVEAPGRRPLTDGDPAVAPSRDGSQPAV